MAEVLRDLVVTLSLNSDNFTRNITSINRQIREAESAFRLAGAGVDNFGDTTSGMASRLSTLQNTLGYQRNAVGQWERALAQANTRLQESHSRYQDYTTRLENARQKHADLGQAIDAQKAKMADIARIAGTCNVAYVNEEKVLKQLEAEYTASGEEVKRLEGQVTALGKTMQRNADAVSAARTNLNNARAAVRETEAAILSCNARLRTAQSAWTAAGRALSDFSSRATAAGKKASALGRTLTLGVTTPIIALGKSVMQSSMDFESSFTSVRKTVDATEEEFARLASASREMSTQIAASTSDINEVMATGGQLGIANEHLTEFTRTMIDLGNSCEDLDADTAATQLAKFANVMKTDQSKFKNIGSTVVDLGNNFATTEAPIVEMSMRLAGAGKQVGLTEAQVLGLATALSSVGIQAQMGGSAMSKALIKMEVAAKTGNKELADFARVSGMTQREFVEAWSRDPVEVFQRFISGVAELNDEGISAVQTLDEMGIKEIRLRDTLLRSVNAHELFADAQERATRAWEENTALEEEANKRYSTLESKLTNLKNKATLFAQTLGDDMTPTVKKAMEGVSGFIDRLQGMDEAQRIQLIRVAGIAAAAGPALLVFGKLSTGVGKVTGAMADFALAVGKAGGGWSGFVSVLAKSPAIWLAVGAAVVYGVAKLYDWASGAKMAREATQGLIDTAKEWKDTAAETFYTSSGAGLSFFGMSEESFRNDNTAASARAWLTGLIDVWTDGKGETDAIVREWTEKWKTLTGSTKASLEELQQTAKEAGHTGISEQIQADIDRLDSMDAEITALLKKRQNGYLTDGEKIRLQELIDQRDAIIVKYKLQPDNETAGFETILNKVQAEVARAQARGQKDADISVYENAVVAAAQGLKAMNEQYDAQYDKEYAVIQLMEEGEEKEQAMAELNRRYSEQRLAAARDYANTLARVMAPVWNQDSMRETGDSLSDLAGKLTAYDAAVKTYGEDSYQAAQALEAINRAASGLDEGNVTEYATALSQVSELLTSGMSMDEVQALFPDIDVSTALEQLASIQQFTSQYSSSLEGLASMFGEGLSEEVLKIATELDMTGAKANWAEFAADPGAITTEAIIAGIQEQEDAARQQVMVDAVIARFTEKPEGADKASLTPEGIIAYVETYAEATTGADVSGLTPDNVTAMVAAYQELAEGADVSTLKPDEIVAYVNKYLQDHEVDTTALTPEAVTAFVLAYQEITGGALTTALTPDDITAYVVKYLEAEGVDVSALTPDQVEALISSFAEATGCDRSALAQSLTGYITQYDDSAATPPAPACRLSISGYDLTSLQQFQANNPVTVTGVVRLADRFENPSDILDDENARFYYDGKQIPVNLVPAEKLTADTIIAYEADGTLHVLLTPDLGSTEAVDTAMGQMRDKVGGSGGTITLFSSTGEDVNRILGLAAAIDDLKRQIDDLNATGGADPSGIGALTEQNIGNVQELQAQLDLLSDTDLANIGQEAAQLMAALESGDLDAAQVEAYTAELQRIYDLVSTANSVLGTGNPVAEKLSGAMQAYDWTGDAATLAASLKAAIAAAMPQVGNDASAGVGQGLGQYDFSGDTATAASNLEGAYRGSLQSQSPAQRMVPLGNDVSAGVGQGMTQYSFAGDSSTAASNLMAALSAALSAQAATAASSARSIGAAISSGIASGISAGQSGVIAAASSVARAAVSAAKAALDIHSPSGVFQREVGLMAMKGMGRGFLEGREEQAKVIRNAARYLTEEARGSIVAGNTHNDNRRTYNQQSTVQLTGNSFYIRDENDIHALAVEIASLTRRRQSGVGLHA